MLEKMDNLNMKHRNEGWMLVKFLIAITATLVLIYMVTSKIQKNLFTVRDFATKANLNFLRASLISFHNDNNYWPNDLKKLVPKYIKKIPPEFLSSEKGSSLVLNAMEDAFFRLSRNPRSKGWIYGAYDGKGKLFARKILPMSSTSSDKTKSTSDW
jgi:competence protein ComGC